jgi:ERCC4-related helicase
MFSTNHGVIERVDIGPGTQVVRVGSEEAGIVQRLVPGLARPTWNVQFLGHAANIPESSLRPAVIKDPIELFRNGRIGRASDFNLKSVAADLWNQHLHNVLVSLDHARVDLKPHQVGVVHRVISNYPHRFMLCDEVGLGKTIEAAMIIKELKARKHTKRILILVPSSLQIQWQFELKTKFNETFAIFNRDTVKYLKDHGETHPWTTADQVIVSHSWASYDKKRRDEITSVDWDLIIVDEAHHAREQKYGSKVSRTNLYRLVNDLVARPQHNRRAALFLTATPMQLQRHELYSLVEMLDPILFSSEEDFVLHIENLSGLSGLVDRLRVNGLPMGSEEIERVAGEMTAYTGSSIDEAMAELHDGDMESVVRWLEQTHRLSEVLIRNRRSKVGEFMPRQAFRWKVTPTSLEKDIYKRLQVVLREGYALAELQNKNEIGFLMSTFQRLATSSNRALLQSLRNRKAKLLSQARTGTITDVDVEEAFEADDTAESVTDRIAVGAELDVSSMIDLIILLERVQTDSKAMKLSEELDKLFEDDPGGKVLIFTQFRETQAMLKEVLGRSGWNVHLFHGQLGVEQKDEVVNRFKRGTGPQVLISTEAGGEGRNLQFCHLLVNYDLPWNPMKVEQRIGRVDRIGQDHPVSVFNLYVEGTIEERVLDVLEHRIRLFTEAIGGLEPIVGEIEADIRKALRLAGDAQDRHLEALAIRAQRQVEDARRADRQMADLILDGKSYGAAIARTARQADEVVTPEHYEEFLKGLLASVNTYLKGPDQYGVYQIQLHSPATVEWPELVEGRDRRRVCFDPRKNVDSEMVEYMGFGHPLIDALVENRVERWPEGNSAVRHVPTLDTSGWQFNWRIVVRSVGSSEIIHPIFVSDGDAVDRHKGAWLLHQSRFRDREELPAQVDVDALERAYGLATQDAAARAEELETDARDTAAGRAGEERSRVEALSDHRKKFAADRVEAAKAALARLEASQRSEDLAVVPAWRANVERALAEAGQVEQDRNEMLAEINRKLTPSVEFSLLNVARIVGRTSLVAEPTTTAPHASGA